jgi:hypothetical protein
MKNTIYSLLLIIALLPISKGFASTTSSTKEVSVNIISVDVPAGLASNTDAYVVVSGMFPNTCYQWSRAEVTSTTPLVHEISFYADLSQHVMCAMHLVPFQQEVQLGRLQSGTHTLRFINGDGTSFEQTLTIE